MFVGRTLIPAPHGQLEARYRPARPDAERVALVLHPHPLYGGTMHNKVVVHTARALEAVGMVTLRINFRGVGDSSGGYGEGIGEAEDARLALDWLLVQQPAAREVWLAGFSFGAAVALRLGGADARVGRIVAIATPARWLDAAVLRACVTPIDFIHGDADTTAPLADLQALLAAAPRTVDTALHVLHGADHFFEDHLDALRDQVASIVV